MDTLPAEVILNIVAFLEVHDIVRLIQLSKRFCSICRDNELWRNISFDKTPWENDRKARQSLARGPVAIPDPRVLEIQRRAAALSSSSSTQAAASMGATRNNKNSASEGLNTESQRHRALANWDPSYPKEKVDWYGEYIARHGPISTSWLQQPTIQEGSTDETHEIRGVALHHDSNGSRVVAPLDDGSVCLWELGHGTKSDRSDIQRKGAIIGRSKAGLLSLSDGADSNELYSHPIRTTAPTGVVECLSVDSVRNKAYFAVHKGLYEVDLNTLQISHYEKYPFLISALSEATFPTPLTVGSTHSLHLHDPRRSMNACWSDSSCTDRVDNVANFPASSRPKNDFYRLLTGDEFASAFAPLFHPGPLAIHHVSSSGTLDASSGEIYVAGRFPSLLIYDRRSFPKLRNTIHSGARLCSLTSVPYPFRSLDDRDLTLQEVHQAKSKSGKTLIACGEYNGKGSLEIYGLSPESNSTLGVPGSTQNLSYKNRVSASRSKLLSVATHGTRLVVSDGDGSLRWMERDGSTLVRRWNINQYEGATKAGIFLSSSAEAHGDVARKLMPVTIGGDDSQADSDELLIWTGERVGVVAFKNRPQFGEDDWEQRVETAEEKIKRREERIYGETMRRALEKQANEVRFVRGLGARVKGF